MRASASFRPSGQLSPPVRERAEKLNKFVELVERDKERLAKLLSNETGKPIKEARGEIANVKIGVTAFVLDRPVPADKKQDKKRQCKLQRDIRLVL